MSENNPSILANTIASSDTPLSPEVAAIVEKAHAGTVEIIERFVSGEQNPLRYYLREANATIACILGKQTKPEYFSQIIALKKQFRDYEAANNTVHEEKKAA